MFFIDPPYSISKKKAGRRLYTHSELDHDRLFDIAAEAEAGFLMTYDDDDIVKRMAEARGFEHALIPMQSRRLNTMYELLISNDLSWTAEEKEKRPRQTVLFEA